MPLDHRREALEGFEPLPLERRAPVLEESPGPAFTVIAPQLPEGLLEQIGGVEPFVGGEQQLEALFPSSVRFSR
jgi:hypothetical protein